MAEQEIKRLNYFNGQFLKEQEFIDEQKYHIHMRRRINYILFEKSGVISVNPDDLKFRINSNSTFTIKAGMAVCISNSEKEAKEIILREDSESFPLSPGQKYWITLNHIEVNSEFSSEGAKPDYTRTFENAEVNIHTSKPDTDEDYVMLGAIEFSSSWKENYDDRQEAKIRTSLIDSVPVTPVNLESIVILPETLSLERSKTQQLNAEGHFDDGTTRILTANDGLTWGSRDTSKAVVDENGLVTGISLGSAEITASAKEKLATVTVEVVALAPELVSIVITPASPTVTEDDHIDLKAKGTFSDGNEKLLISSEVTWNSDNDGIAKVNANGRVTGQSAGSANIKATSTASKSISDSVKVTVISAVLVPVFVQGIPGISTNQFVPNGGTEGTEVSIYGKHFRIDTTKPQVELVDTQENIMHRFDVDNVESKTVLNVEYHIIKAKVGSVSHTVPKSGKIKIITSGGWIISDEKFVIYPS